mmetsp:Transcript_87902/g.246912  ORF Transcript_87902/g.246912 Transcript_87902/m.246912 type:complete len:259 (+) Transcript_87902:480-1256(+)
MEECVLLARFAPAASATLAWGSSCMAEPSSSSDFLSFFCFFAASSAAALNAAWVLDFVLAAPKPLAVARLFILAAIATFALVLGFPFPATAGVLLAAAFSSAGFFSNTSAAAAAPALACGFSFMVVPPAATSIFFASVPSEAGFSTISAGVASPTLAKDPSAETPVMGFLSATSAVIAGPPLARSSAPDVPAPAGRSLLLWATPPPLRPPGIAAPPHGPSFAIALVSSCEATSVGLTFGACSSRRKRLNVSDAVTVGP